MKVTLTVDQLIQLFHAGIISHSEARHLLGFSKEMMK